MILQKRLIFKKSTFDLPLLIFLLSQFLSTLFSIDKITSVFGYYSRFNGGLLSSVCFALLYWAYVSNISKDQTKAIFKTILFSALLVSIYGILEHFGKSISCLLITSKFDTACWVQDVQNRVFATIGQPNWLAAWIVALFPLTFALALTKNIKDKQFWYYYFSSGVLFAALLYTKSRSGLIAFIVSSFLFWGFMYLKRKAALKPFVLFTTLFIVLVLINGSPWTPSIFSLQQEKTESPKLGTSLETGGTESGTIRRIVWQGAWKAFQANPLIGTGVETFAYTYYQYRAVEHNTTSEWDFLYNKAHNEVLNFAANTGSLGLLAYLAFNASVLLYAFKTIISSNKNAKENKLENTSRETAALASGFASLFVSNFFGFSVVITSLLFFLFPAMIVSINTEQITKVVKKHTLNLSQKLFLGLLVLVCGYLLMLISKFWLADKLFAQGRRENENGNFSQSQSHLTKAILIFPFFANYHDQLAISYSNLAIELLATNKIDLSNEFLKGSLRELEITRDLAPRNINLAKSRANVFIDLAQIDKSYFDQALSALNELIPFAPTDASIYHRIALIQASKGDLKAAVPNFYKAIELKPDYKRARQALAYILIQLERKEEAQVELEYILKYISPDDELVKKDLEGLEKE